MKTAPSIGEYLIQRLYAHGVRHVFGIPGDYVLGFYDQLSKSKLRLINTCDEQGAGFAADAYARVRGLGAVCVTYCVGGLKLANTTAEAFAEKSPVVVISGAPGMKEREKNPLLHHKVREFDTQKKVFEQLTIASTVLSDPQTAFQEIDRVLHAALRFKRPVYIELPRDLVTVPGIPHHKTAEIHERSDYKSLREALAEAERMINAARQPVILADVEVHRFGLQDQLLKLARKSNIPVAATVLGKSVIGEDHPFYLGVYEGGMGRDDVRQYVESSDCVIMLGAFLTDINLGIYTARLDPARSIYATSEKLSIRYHTYEEVRFKDFIGGLVRSRLRRRRLGKIPRPPQIIPHSALLQASHGQTPLRVAQRLPVREHGRRGRRRGRFVRRGRPVHPRAHRIHQPRLLHLDGFRRARERRCPIGQPEAATAGPGWRRRLSDDGHGIGHGRPLPPQPGGRPAQQPRLRHRAAHAGRPL
jgi:indolepyruvate decarboxylase